MNAIDKTVSSDITLGQLLDGLATAPEAPLVFLYEGQPVKAGYHVTRGQGGCILEDRLRCQPRSLVGDVRPALGYRRGRQEPHAGGGET